MDQQTFSNLRRNSNDYVADFNYPRAIDHIGALKSRFSHPKMQAHLLNDLVQHKDMPFEAILWKFITPYYGHLPNPDNVKSIHAELEVQCKVSPGFAAALIEATCERDGIDCEEEIKTYAFLYRKYLAEKLKGI